MAKHKRESRGSTFYGLLAGLLIGLAAAAAVAYFFMNSPMPFVDKASRSFADRELNPDKAPDPNQGLVPQSGQAKAQDDAIGALIATLPVDPEKAKPTLPPIAKPPPPPTKEAPVVATDGKSYFLQVGAFRVLEDAESMRAQMLLLGLPVQIQRAEVNGLQVNRVRIGPYAKLDDMNAARAKLAAENIKANVVRQ